MYADIIGEPIDGRRALVAIEASRDAAVDQADLGGYGDELCLRQSATHSGGPQSDIAARVQ